MSHETAKCLSAAGALIIAESGGRLSGFSGNEFAIRGSETLASNGVIHDEMLAVLKQMRA